MKSICPYCRKKLNIPDNYIGKEARCPNCSQPLLVGPEGAKPKPLDPKDKGQGFTESISTERGATENGKKNPDALLAVVSFFVPLIGFILGIVFVIKPSQVDKNTAKRCLGWALTGSIVWGIIIGIWMGMVTGEIDEATAKFEREIKRIETTCMICNGRGQVDCPMCVNGVSTNPLTGRKETCSFCNGQGVTTCTFCDGTGRPK